MYLRQVTHTYIIRKEDTVSMIPEYRFPLKRKCGFLHIGTPVSNLRNWGVKPPGILSEITKEQYDQWRYTYPKMEWEQTRRDLDALREKRKAENTTD